MLLHLHATTFLHTLHLAVWFKVHVYHISSKSDHCLFSFFTSVAEGNRPLFEAGFYQRQAFISKSLPLINIIGYVLG